VSDRPSQITQTVRAGLECDDATGAVVPPIHLTSTFAFRCFGEKRSYDYTRSGNPTRDLLGAAIAELELGVGGVITATGMAAITLVGYLIPAGARIIVAGSALFHAPDPEQATRALKTAALEATQASAPR